VHRAKAGFAALALLATPGCGHADRAPLKVRIDLGPARSFRGFTLFYPGRFAGKLPLTYDGRDDLRPYARGLPVFFGYGDCTPDPDSEDKCSLPMEVGNFPICKQLPSRYAKPVPLRRIQLRGVPAVVFLGEKQSFWKLELYTGRTAVDIEGVGGYRHALELARRLEPLNHRPFGRRLPPPAPPCARKEFFSPR
jgi:hypothetical protein